MKSLQPLTKKKVIVNIYSKSIEERVTISELGRHFSILAVFRQM